MSISHYRLAQHEIRAQELQDTCACGRPASDRRTGRCDPCEDQHQIARNDLTRYGDLEDEL